MFISRFTLALALSLIVVFIARGHAGTITWGPAVNVVNSSDVSTSGSYVDALHTNPEVGNQTIGDTIFHHQTVVTTVSNQTGSTANISVEVNGPIGFGVGGVGAPRLPATVTGAYLNALNYLDYGSNSDNTQFGTITLAGLTIDNFYQIQVWSAQADSQNYVTTYTSGANARSLSLNPGQFTLGTFVADATTQSLKVQRTAGAAIYYGVNAVALRDITAVPEPTSLGMIGLAGAFIANRRRVK